MMQGRLLPSITTTDPVVEKKMTLDSIVQGDNLPIILPVVGADSVLRSTAIPKTYLPLVVAVGLFTLAKFLAKTTGVFIDTFFYPGKSVSTVVVVWLT